jgi:site-specific DNA-methyltransferase (adenine-specific)
MDISTNIVYNGDCIDILKILPNKSIDMILVDLPYGQTACNWDIPINLEDMWKELKRISKDNTCMAFFTTVKFGNKLINSNEKMFRYDLVMPKNIVVGFFNVNKQPLRGHELVYIFYKKQPIYHPQKTEGTPYTQHTKFRECAIYGNGERRPILNDGYRNPRSIIPVFNKDKVKHNHPTRKPIKTCEWLIKTYTNENDIVLDFTCGGGSTLKGCINTNRRYIGIEKDPEIYKQCLENLE